jgi:hypothetical protein
MENYLIPGDKNLLAGLFSNKDSAEKAYFELKANGYLAEEINVLMSKETQVQYYSYSSDNNLISGGIADDVPSFGTNLKIPWPGLVVSGPLENDFNIRDEKGYHTVMEAVLKAGIPKDEMVRYIEGINSGKILITVYCRSDDKQKAGLLQKTF